MPPIRMAGGAGRKLRVGLIVGGRSAEHEISLRSARSIVTALDRDRFDPVLIGIDPTGRWHLLDEKRFTQLDGAGAQGREIVPTAIRVPTSARSGGDPGASVDVIFPVLHGAYGEDGTIQGMLEMLEVPYVGAGVLGSAVGMDKDVQKRLLRDAGIPIVPFVAATQTRWENDAAALRQQALDLGLPLFVKPANLGSSIGITKVSDRAALDIAIEHAFSFDPKIVIERGLDVREIECSVLGNDAPEASIPGEIAPGDEFYSYEDKYSSESGARLLIPAPLSPALVAAVRDLAVRTFSVLECSGMARVDFFLERGTDRLYVNELNSIPGFTSISMYPKLWEASGLSYSALISRLIELALERHTQRRQLRTPRADRER